MFNRNTHSFMARQTTMTPEMKQQIVLRIITYLRQNRKQTLRDLQEKFGQELPIEELGQHQSVKIIDADNQRYFVYNPFITIKYKCVLTNSDDIVKLCSSNPDGILFSDIIDAYPAAQEHLTVLISSGKLITIDNIGRNGSSDSTIVYPGDLAAIGAPVDASVLALWDEIEIPKTSADLETLLKEAGHEVHVKQVILVQSVKKKKSTTRNIFANLQRGRITNQHLAKQLRKGMEQ